MADHDLDRAAAAAIVNRVAGQAVVVLGDVMLDRYWWGSVNRLSPEAPVPIVQKERASTALGGAANVAANVASLGGVPWLVGVVGSDDAGRELRAELVRRGITDKHLLAADARPTTVKTRIVAISQHVVRVDEEDRSPVDAALSAGLAEQVEMLFDTANVIVVSDYAKGVLGPELLQRVIGTARRRGYFVVVDPKVSNYERYRGASLICPNRSEALAATGVDADDPDSVNRAGRRLLDSAVAESVLITLGDAGMALFERGRAPVRIPTVARAVYDVTGAGDTVVAAVGLALAAGATLEVAARLANVAAGLAVEQVGTAAVGAAQLLEALDLGEKRKRAPVR